MIKGLISNASPWGRRDNIKESQPKVLDPDVVLEGLIRLRKRIDERFPCRNLGLVCRDLEAIARDVKRNCRSIEKPIWGLRFGIAGLVLLAVGMLIMTLNRIDYAFGIKTLADLVLVLDSGVNDLVMVFLGIFFLVSLEKRIKRKVAFRVLRELNALIHVIDMHQLTKDPGRLLNSWKSSLYSPKNTMSSFELVRYLDYCSEMLSFVSKVASLHIQRIDDPEIIAAVNKMEILTTGLSRKIWQKIMIIRGMEISKSSAAS